MRLGLTPSETPLPALCALLATLVLTPTPAHPLLASLGILTLQEDKRRAQHGAHPFPIHVPIFCVTAYPFPNAYARGVLIR